MAEGKRARRRAEVEERLLDVGRDHLAAYGAAALSLRAVARDLGMVPSALYRYVRNRDDLLTVLIVDAYESLGAATAAATPAADDDDAPFSERFAAQAGAIRRWALDHPHQYALIYGSPVPGYVAPAERTGPAAATVTAPLLRLITAAARADTATGHGDAEPQALADLAVRAVGGTLPPDPFFFPDGPPPSAAFALGVLAWQQVLGVVSGEVFGYTGADLPADRDAFFELAVIRAFDTARSGGGDASSSSSAPDSPSE